MIFCYHACHSLTDHVFWLSCKLQVLKASTQLLVLLSYMYNIPTIAKALSKNQLISTGV